MMKKLIILFFLFVSICSYGKKYQNKYAKGFLIEDNESDLKLTIFNPFDDFKSVFATYNLSLDIKENYITIPSKRVAPLSCPFVAFCNQLNVVDNIVAIESSKYLFNERVYNNYLSGKVKQVGESHIINNELLLSLNPDVVFVPGWEKGINSCKTIQNAGVNVVYMFGYMEQHPLGRTEWIKVVSLFFNKLKMAETVFNNIEQRYTNLVEIAKKEKNRTSTICGGVYRGIWYAPGANSYLATSLKNANANYLFDEYKESGSVPLKKEQVIIKSQQADVWIVHAMGEPYPSSISRDREFYSKTNPWKNNKVYSNIGSISAWGANNYWEDGIVNPDIILADYIKMMYPHLLPNHKLVYYKAINTKLL